MNALNKATRIFMPRAQILQTRMASSASASGPMVYKDLCVKKWSSDAGAYPIMAILTFAVGFCSWRVGKSAFCQDVRITPSARQTLIRPNKE